MPNELHLSLFPGLNLNRDEVGEWSLGLGLSPHSDRTIAHLGSPETSLLPQARELMSSLGNTAVRLGTSLFAPQAEAGAADSRSIDSLDPVARNRFEIESLTGSLTTLSSLQESLFQSLPEQLPALQASLLNAARSQERIVEEDVGAASVKVRLLESQSGIHDGFDRAHRRMAEVMADVSLPSEEAPASLDSDELVEARRHLSQTQTRLDEARQVRGSLEGSTLDPDPLETVSEFLLTTTDTSLRERMVRLFNQVGHPELVESLRAIGVADAAGLRQLTNEAERLSCLDLVHQRIDQIENWSQAVGNQADNRRFLYGVSDGPMTVEDINNDMMQTREAATASHERISEIYVGLTAAFSPRIPGETENDFASRLAQGREALTSLENGGELPVLQNEAVQAQRMNATHDFFMMLSVTSIAGIPAMVVAEVATPVLALFLSVRNVVVATRLIEGAVFVAGERGLNLFLRPQETPTHGFLTDTIRMAGLFGILGKAQGALKGVMDEIGAGAVTRAVSSFAAEMGTMGGYDFATVNAENAAEGTFDPMGAAERTLGAQAWKDRLASLIGLRIAGTVTRPYAEALRSEVQQGVQENLPRWNEALTSLARTVLPLGRPIFGVAVGAVGEGPGAPSESPVRSEDGTEIIASNNARPPHIVESEYRAVADFLTRNIEKHFSLEAARRAIDHLYNTLADPKLREDFSQRLLPELMSRNIEFFTPGEITDTINERLAAVPDPSLEGQQRLANDSRLFARAFRLVKDTFSAADAGRLLDRVAQNMTDSYLRLEALSALGRVIDLPHLRPWLTAILQTPVTPGRMAQLFTAPPMPYENPHEQGARHNALLSLPQLPQPYLNASLAPFVQWMTHTENGRTTEVRLRDAAGHVNQRDTVIAPADPTQVDQAVQAARNHRIDAVTRILSEFFESLGEAPLQTPEPLRGVAPDSTRIPTTHLGGFSPALGLMSLLGTDHTFSAMTAMGMDLPSVIGSIVAIGGAVGAYLVGRARGRSESATPAPQPAAPPPPPFRTEPSSRNPEPVRTPAQPQNQPQGQMVIPRAWEEPVGPDGTFYNVEALVEAHAEEPTNPEGDDPNSRAIPAIRKNH